MKTDLKKTIPSYSAAPTRVDIIEVQPLRYLAMDAQGAPDDEGFKRAIAALYPMAYAIKFASKRDLDRDYVVPPLEALWWADDMETFTVSRDKSQWQSTAMIVLPDWISADAVDAARDQAAAKVPPEDLSAVRVDTFEEGLCAQTLHVGSFDDEGPTVDRVHQHIDNAGFALAGKHHEIYLSDFRRTAPEKLRTILRQPCAR